MLNLEIGDIIFEKGRGPISWCIKKVTNSEYSHVAVYYGNGLVIHSHLLGGVHITNLKSIGEYDVYRIKEGLTDKQKTLMKSACIDYLGMQYDLPQIFGYLWTAVFEGDNKLNNPNLVICSELVDILYNVLGYDLLEGRLLGDVTPEQLRESKLIEKILFK